MDTSNFQSDISDLSAALAEGLERLRYGSYSDRNPGLGKMRTCPFCHVRRHEFDAEKCCNPNHRKVVDAPFGKQLFRRFRHKRHSNTRRHQIHDMALALQDDAFRAKMHTALHGLPSFHRAAGEIPLSGIPSFAEKVIIVGRKIAANKSRKQEQNARRINFGLGG